jgi:hypothetical protein
MIVVRAASFVLGLFIVQAVLRSAIRTVVVPRGEQTILARRTFLFVRFFYDALSARARTAEGSDRIMARYGPTALLALSVVWAAGVIIGFDLMLWAADRHTFHDALFLSGSSITTLGVVPPNGTLESVLIFAEALIGLGIIALLISYLPTIYTMFSQREAEVVKFDVRAGSPPTAIEMLTRYHRIEWIDGLPDEWRRWEQWFAEVEQSHTTHPILVFFRSQRPRSSWITCAGAVLDTMAVTVSALDVPDDPQAEISMRAGFLALRAIANFFGAPIDDDPAPNAPISVYRQEFLLLCEELEARGLPVKEDREQAWHDFAGWRVNYDQALLAICALFAAPPTPWSSDRISHIRKPTFFRTHWRVGPIDNPASW